MAIKRNGKIIKCPECKSDNIEVIEVRAFDYGTKCKDCGKKFLTGHPIIKGQKDYWNHPKDTAIWN